MFEITGYGPRPRVCSLTSGHELLTHVHNSYKGTGGLRFLRLEQGLGICYRSEPSLTRPGEETLRVDGMEPWTTTVTTRGHTAGVAT